jgi:hypothetical protein
MARYVLDWRLLCLRRSSRCCSLAQEAFFAKHFGFQRSRTFNAGKPNEYIMLKLGSVRLEIFRTDLAKTEHQKGGEWLGFQPRSTAFCRPAARRFPVEQKGTHFCLPSEFRANIQWCPGT